LRALQGPIQIGLTMANVILATKTLAAIEAQIASDQGAAYRGYLKQVLPHMGDAYRTESESFRSHMGASIMGGKCGRAIWYSFRWATVPSFTGRIQRLFNRGHLEEARFIACLLAIGVAVYQQDESGKQYRISGSAGHYGGSGDGIGIGIPDLPGTAAVLEFKTHNDTSFKSLVKSGVRDSKFEHYVQMQQYMRKMGLPASLYMAVNKNNDELYAEIVLLDTATADMFIERADKIVWMINAPPQVGNPPSPGNYDCKWCDHKPVCFKQLPPAKNCRTCVFGEPTSNGDGEWVCLNTHSAHNKLPLSKALQLTGCNAWAKHPDIGI
jgi:hypothetical protein